MRITLPKLALLAMTVAWAGPCHAQHVNPLGIFGEILRQGQMQGAREAWARMPGTNRACLERGLASRNSSIEAVIQYGITPADPRLGRLFEQCRRFETPLRRAFSCVLGTSADGQPVRTICNQSFARRGPDGSTVTIGPQEAMDLQFSGTPVFLTEVETPEGVQSRREQSEARLRAQHLQALLAGNLTPYLHAASPVVRTEATRLQDRINQQLAAQPGPSAAATDEILRDVQELVPLETAETARMAALDRIAPLRAQAEARTTDDTAAPLRARLGELRVAFKAVSELPRPSAMARAADDASLGPSFDCNKAITPLATLICVNPDLRTLDLEMARPAYVLRQLSADTPGTLKTESQELVARAAATCRLPPAGSLTPALRARAAPCVADIYRRQKAIWTERVGQTAPTSARQEVARPLREHVRLQGLLRNIGLLPPDAVVDGIYGGGTRQAVIALAEAERLPADGFLSDTLADRLARRAASPAPGRTPYDSGLVARIDALASRYQTYLADLSEDQRDRLARREAQARLDTLQGRVKTLLTGALPDDLRADLGAALRAARGAGPDPRATAERLGRAMESLEPRMRDAEAVQRAVTDRNRFLAEGSGSDIVLLYNSSPAAAAVARTLDGSLAFDATRMTACAVPDPITDRFVQERLRLKAHGLGAPVEVPLPPCAGDQARTADLLAVERGALLRQPGRFVAVASAIEAGVYTLMGTLQDAEVQAARQAERNRSAEIAEEVARGTSGGFGLVGIQNGSRAVCRVAAPPADLHDRLLQPHRALLERELDGPPSTEEASAESAFQGAKRGRCGAIYASAAELAVVTKALARDGVAFRYLPVWIAVEAAEPPAAAPEPEPKESKQETSASGELKQSEPQVEAAPPPPETPAPPLQPVPQPAPSAALPSAELAALSPAPPQPPVGAVPQPPPWKPNHEVVALLLQLQYLTADHDNPTQDVIDAAVREFARDYNIAVPKQDDVLIEQLRGAIKHNDPVGPCRTADSSAGAVCIR